MPHASRPTAHVGVAAGLLFGKAPDPPTALKGQFVTLGLLFLAVCIVGISILVFLKRWRDRAALKPPSASEQLADFETLFTEGKLSPEEYHRIKSKLTKQLRRELAVPEKPAAQNPEQGAPSPAPPSQNGPSS